jgi:hypothetical protein
MGTNCYQQEICLHNKCIAERFVIYSTICPNFSPREKLKISILPVIEPRTYACDSVSELQC